MPAAAPAQPAVRKKPETGKQPNRSITLDRAKVDTAKRTVPVAFASEAPVCRCFGEEILDCGPGSVRMDRMRNGAPGLMDHDASLRSLIGVIESASVDEDRVCRALLRFPTEGIDEQADRIFKLINDGIISRISVGYSVHKWQATINEETDEETWRAIDWEPMEVSFVAIPADDSVGVGRSVDTAPRAMSAPANATAEQNSTPAAAAASAAPATASRAQVDDTAQRTVNERELVRVREIMHLGAKYGAVAEAETAIRDGKPLDEFQGYILREKLGATPAPIGPAKIGLTKKEIRDFSFLRYVRSFDPTNPGGAAEAAFEREAVGAATDLARKTRGGEIKGAILPDDIFYAEHREQRGMRDALTRGLNATTFSQGGALVQTDVLGSSLIELLRNRVMVRQLGARTLSGLQGNVAIPRQTGGGTAYWLPETGNVTASTPSLGHLVLTPKRLVAQLRWTKQLVAQTGIDSEAFGRMDMMQVLALAMDLAAINGAGSAGEPCGILNTSGIGTVTFGATATRLKAIEFQTGVAGSNALLGSLHYLTTPAVAGKWLGIAEAANTAEWLWKGNVLDGTVVGFPAHATLQMPAGIVLFGNFNDLILADWTGFDVTVDPYTAAGTGEIIITIQMLADTGVRHAASFSKSTDSGAQ